jgi:hypothetical protein
VRLHRVVPVGVVTTGIQEPAEHGNKPISVRIDIVPTNSRCSTALSDLWVSRAVRSVCGGKLHDQQVRGMGRGREVRGRVSLRCSSWWRFMFRLRSMQVVPFGAALGIACTCGMAAAMFGYAVGRKAETRLQQVATSELPCT